MKITKVLLSALMVSCSTFLFAQVQIDKPIQLTGGTGERVITNLELPVNGTDAVNKDYVDAAVAASGGSAPTMMSDESPGTMYIMLAAQYCKTLVESTFSDWRLGNFSELYGLLSNDATTIPNMTSSNYFIMANDILGGSSSPAVLVNFSSGYSQATSATSAYYVRCVR